MTTAVFDLNAIKKQAQANIKEGAVTQDYQLDKAMALELLNEALATEIMCVLRYYGHAISVKGMDYQEVKEEFLEHAKQEEEHMLMLAERINQLGGEPDFNPASVIEKSVTEFGQAKSLMAMLKEDLIAERIAIMVYKKLIAWFGEKDPTTRIMLENILKQEEDHANDLADFLHANTES